MDLDNFLQKNHIVYKKYTHKATFTVAESLVDAKVNNIPGIRCKTLFLKDENGQFYLVGLEGTKRLDVRRLERTLEVKKLRFASVLELRDQIHVTPGNVSILSAVRNNNVIVIIDDQLRKERDVGFHPSKNTETYVFSGDNFIKVFNALPNKKNIIYL